MKKKLKKSKFYAILDTIYISPEKWIETCQILLDGQVDLIQLRAKKESSAEREKLLQDILPLFENSKTALIVNDDIELVKKYPNVGLHIGQDDTSVLKARYQLGSSRIIGLSTHTLHQAKQAIAFATDLDYFAVGPVYETQTKPEAEIAGIELIERIALLKPKLPFFAIGGINRKSIHAVKEAGVERIAVVSDILTDKDPAAVMKELRKAL